MKQVLQSFKSGELWLAEVPAPLCSAKGVMMANQVSFVSAGTERMLVDFAQKNLIGKAIAMPDQVQKVIRKIKTEGLFNTLEKVKTKLEQPIPLGYSCAGVVQEVGSQVPGLTVGDRVACGGAGFANHAEFNFIPKNLLVKIPEGVTFEDASCATIGSIALQGARQCDLRLGEIVCVMGLGLLGVLAVQMLKASGCRVIGFDPNPSRCELARELGVDLAVDGNLKAACDNFSEGYGVDAVLITAATKSNEPVTMAGEIARHKGKVVVTGLVGMDLPREQYYKKELDFKLSLSYGPGRYDSSYEEGGNDYPYGYVRWTEQRNIKAFLDLVAAGKVTPAKLITHRFKFDDALNAYELLTGKIDEPYLGITLSYPAINTEMPQRRIDISTKIPRERKNNEINVGFIGVGNFAKGVLLPAVRKNKDMLVRATCSASGMSAGETAKCEDADYASSDYKELLNDKNLDAVFVSTKHDTHAKLASEALRAAKHVFLEKPLAITPESLDMLETAATESSKILMAGFNRRFSPHAQVINDYFKNRKTPMFVNYRVNAGLIPPDNWLQNPEVGGGRIIGEGCHFIDFASFLIGSEPVGVIAVCAEANNSAIVDDDNCSICVKYADGSLLSLQYLALGTPDISKERCEVFAEESVAIMDDFRITKCSGKLGKKSLKGAQRKGFVEEITAFSEAIRNGTESPIPLLSLVNTSRCAFAALESFKTRCMVSIR